MGCDAEKPNEFFEAEYISIHAPIVGCDLARYRRGTGVYRYFNPRTHRGVRRFSTALMVAPCELISIHAPIVGCDEFGLVDGILDDRKDFNPRTHRGVRLEII